MPHDIHNASMVYAGATPWHGIGTRLPANATWEEVYKMAGFYEALEAPAYSHINGVSFQIPDRKVIYRSDVTPTPETPDNGYLGTMGAGYKVVQFSEMAAAVVDACHGVQAVIHTAGLMGETGSRGWILAELPAKYQIRIQGDDSVVRPYVLAANGHDGSLALHFRNCAERVVCRNTLGVALGEKGGASWTIRHTSSAPDRLANAAQALKALGDRMLRFQDLGNAMAKFRLTDDAFERAVAAAVPIPDDGEEHRDLQERRTEIRAMRETDETVNAAIRGTAWGDFNAITRALDWKGRATNMSAAQRMEHASLGTGAAQKARVLEVISVAAGLPLSRVVSAT